MYELKYINIYAFLNDIAQLNKQIAYSPASEWIFIKIFAVRKIMVLNGSLGSEE